MSGKVVRAVGIGHRAGSGRRRRLLTKCPECGGEGRVVQILCRGDQGAGEDCDACVFAYDGRDCRAWEALHPNEDEPGALVAGAVPEWCPFRAGPVTFGLTVPGAPK